MSNRPRPAPAFPRWLTYMMFAALALFVVWLLVLVPHGWASAAEPTTTTTSTASQEEQDAQAWAPYPCLDDWYVNPDEEDRLPGFTPGEGMVFEPNNLIHHQTDIALSALQPGTYNATPAPDQPSFFSVEVRDDNSNYGTLRWDGLVWSITIGAGSSAPGGPATAGTYTDASPVDLLDGLRSKWGTADFDDTTHVVSFGVGYTLNPPGSVVTTVKTVTFAGTTYDFTCVAATETTAPATTETSAPAEELPKTGPSGILKLGAGGFTLVFLGVVVLLISRGRRSRREG